MPYLDIVFHNIQHGGTTINQAGSQDFYRSDFIESLNVGQSTAGPHTPENGVPAPSAGWGDSITDEETCVGIFFCESPVYTHDAYVDNWAEPQAVPEFPTDHIASGFVPSAGVNNFCAFLEGDWDLEGDEDQDEEENDYPLIPLNPASPEWIGSQAIRCIGTGAAPLGNGAAPWGSDRYALLFQTARRTYPNGNGIRGVFVHTKNTAADPGTQITALCRRYPNEIIFGDLNLDIRAILKFQSLEQAIAGTHTILAIQNPAAGNSYFYTHYFRNTGSSCLDYALVPNAHTADVELWAHRPNPYFPFLSRNTSDHSVMCLRIRCA